jgi:hypothetical protein
VWIHDDDGGLCWLGGADDAAPPAGATSLGANDRRALVRALGEPELARLWHAHVGGLAGTAAPDAIAARRWIDDALEGATAQLVAWRIVPARGPHGVPRSPAAAAPIDLRELAPPPRPDHWVEVRVLDDDGAPLGQIALTLIDGSGARRSARTDAAGVAHWRNLVPGATRVLFDDPDAFYVPDGGA